MPPIVCPGSLRSCVLQINFSPIRTPGKIMSFGVSPVNYSDSYRQTMVYISVLRKDFDIWYASARGRKIGDDVSLIRCIRINLLITYLVFADSSFVLYRPCLAVEMTGYILL